METLRKANKKIYESFGKSAANIIIYYDGDERSAMLKGLRAQVEELSNLEERLTIAETISELLPAHYDGPEAGIEENRDYRVEEYKSQLSRIETNLSTNENMKEFDRIVNELLIADAEGNEKDGAEGVDGELQLTGDTMNLIDPVTKKRMIDPVKNTICSHTYDLESVVALLRINPLTRCPVPGCKYKEPLSIENMKSDIAIKTYLEKHPA